MEKMLSHIYLVYCHQDGYLYRITNLKIKQRKLSFENRIFKYVKSK